MAQDNLIAELTIPGEPISPVNHYMARAIKSGGRWTAMMYIASKYRNYQQTIKDLVDTYVSENNLVPVDHPVRVEAKFYFGTKRRKDLSNAGKLEWDAFNGRIWKDDSQILKLDTEKRYDKSAPRTEVKVFKFESQYWPTD